MKFLVSKKLSRKSPIFPPLVGLLLFFFVAIFYNFAYIHSKISLFPQEMSENILGNEEAFIEPLLPQELLTIVHTELLFFMFVMLLLFFIYHRLYKNTQGIKELLVNFLLIQTALISLSFSQTVGVSLIYLFLSSFFLANAMLLYIIIKTALKLVRNG